MKSIITIKRLRNRQLNSRFLADSQMHFSSACKVHEAAGRPLFRLGCLSAS